MKPTRAQINDHKRFLRRQQTFERIYRKQFYSWLASVNSNVAKWMDENDSLLPDINSFIDGNRLDGIYRRLYTRLTIDEARISWQQIDSRINGKERKDIIDLFASIFGTSDDGAPINLWRRLLNDYLTVRIARRIQEVEQTTVKRIAALIEKGIADGLGAREVATTIRKDTGFNRNRSLAIARTETITALNQGKYLAAQSSPYVMEKKWMPTIDARTRLSHRDMYDRPFIPLNQPFYVANANGVLEEAQYPGDVTLSASNVIQCRCSLLTQPRLNPNGRPIRKSATDIKSMKPKEFTTTIRAIDPKDGKLKTWSGQRITARSWEEAKKFVQDNGMGYLDVDGEFAAEI